MGREELKGREDCNKQLGEVQRGRYKKRGEAERHRVRDREREWEKQQGIQKEKHRSNTPIVRHRVIFRYFRKI